VVGSGNFHATNALIAAGVRFVPAAHEGGAATMADAYARTAGEPAVLSVHQGPGVTNALTGITEAAKSRTPLIVLAPEATAARSNFFIDLPACAASVGAEFRRVRGEQVYQDVAEAHRVATQGRGGTVVLGLPLDVQTRQAPEYPSSGAAESPTPEPPVPGQQVRELAGLLRRNSRPVFIAGRGATRAPERARAAITELAGRCGALLAVSAAAKGLFAGDPWYLDVSGGFASPLAADLISRSDLVVAWEAR
jgi:thiamine pyrophosphate-dependent acetolactate synthase large subunit-like protein